MNSVTNKKFNDPKLLGFDDDDDVNDSGDNNNDDNNDDDNNDVIVVTGTYSLILSLTVSMMTYSLTNEIYHYEQMLLILYDNIVH